MPRAKRTEKSEFIREAVRSGYAEIAKSGGGCCASTACCGTVSSKAAAQLAHTVGYGESELAMLPDGANMGLSCGNPVALALLTPGEVVVDLGSGGGFDVFLAGPRVGAQGHVIGVDMTPEMVAKARANIAAYRKRTKLDNVEFRLGEIEHLPIADNTADVVISNCVINLSPDKPQVWREIFRVLKPGGRAAVSDLALLKPLPKKATAAIEALVGCVAGAVLVTDTERMAKGAGLADVRTRAKPEYVDAMSTINDPLYRRLLTALPSGEKLSDYVVSVEVSAVKPRKCGCG